jgi:hypothetical protein
VAYLSWPLRSLLVDLLVVRLEAKVVNYVSFRLAQWATKRQPTQK